MKPMLVEQAATKAATASDMADLTVIMEQVARQQALMMATLQSDDRRVRPKTDP